MLQMPVPGGLYDNRRVTGKVDDSIWYLIGYRDSCPFIVKKTFQAINTSLLIHTGFVNPLQRANISVVLTFIFLV